MTDAKCLASSINKTRTRVTDRSTEHESRETTARMGEAGDHAQLFQRATMKLIIAGPRGLTARDKIFRVLDLHVSPMLEEIELFVSGAAQGVDTIAETWAIEHGYSPKRFPVTTELRARLGSRAPFYRNTQMATFVGRRGGLLIVHDGPGIVTPGSKQMLETARALSLQFIKSVSVDTPNNLKGQS